jgi:hypothetical protein
VKDLGDFAGLFFAVNGLVTKVGGFVRHRASYR